MQSCPDRRLKLVAKPETLDRATLVDAYPIARRTSHVNSKNGKYLMLRLNVLPWVRLEQFKTSRTAAETVPLRHARVTILLASSTLLVAWCFFLLTLPVN